MKESLSTFFYFVCEVKQVCWFPFQVLRFPRGWRWASSSLCSCGVSPVQLIPQESTHLPLQSTGFQ